MTHSRHSSTTSRQASHVSTSRPSSSYNYSHSPVTPNSPSAHMLHRTSSSHSRRSSVGYSPTQRRSMSGSGFFDNSGIVVGEEGAGTLADELGGWSEGDEEDEDFDEEEEDSGEESGVGAQRHGEDGERDSGIDVTSPQSLNGKSTRRKAGQGLGISESEDETKEEDSEDEEDCDEVVAEEMRLTAANLEARLAAIESLSRRGVGGDGPDDGSVARMTESLKDLGGQAGIEMGVTRLVTAHTAISTHLAHQTVYLQHLTSTLFSPLNTRPLPDQLIDPLIPSIADTIALLPELTPSPLPLDALHTLSQKTNSLVSALATVSDSIHIVNQSPAVAAQRQLRTVKEKLSEFRIEEKKRGEGVRYIEEGCWDQRLRVRECERKCADVLGGFEDVCGRWREWLVERERMSQQSANDGIGVAA